MRPLGILIILACLLTPLYWYAGWIMGPDGSAMFSQYIGSVAIIAMALSQMLSTRIAGLEAVFGGLDRIYVIHKWLGILAVVTLLIHDTVDAELKGRETFLTDLGETLGEISLYAILILVVITIVTFIPYSLWRWTHKFMGAFFVFGALHYILLMKPLDPVLPIGIYMLVFCALGVISYIYTLLPLRSKSGYIVRDIAHHGDITSVSLKPESKGISHRAGQFAFLEFDIAGLGEIHPFTISKAPDNDGALRFTIKELGDYTSRLGSQLEIGKTAKVSPAYGHFIRRNRRPEIWIAGGIGITPFLAWLDNMEQPKHPVHLFYCVREMSDVVQLEELQAKQSIDNFNLHIIASKEEGRLTAEKVSSMIDFDVSQADVYYCGPENMRNALSKSFSKMGMSRSRFHYEEFEIRSGLGFRNLLSLLFGLFKK